MSFAVTITANTVADGSARPICSTLEAATGLRKTGDDVAEPMRRRIMRSAISAAVITVIVAIAILFPDFDRVVALFGSVCCFAICIILPLLFHLRLFGDSISPGVRIFEWSMVVVCSFMSVFSTIAALLPREAIRN